LSTHTWIVYTKSEAHCYSKKHTDISIFSVPFAKAIKKFYWAVEGEFYSNIAIRIKTFAIGETD
jgi:hypothetical protein